MTSLPLELSDGDKNEDTSQEDDHDLVPPHMNMDFVLHGLPTRRRSHPPGSHINGTKVQEAQYNRTNEAPVDTTAVASPVGAACGGNTGTDESGTALQNFHYKYLTR